MSKNSRTWNDVPLVGALKAGVPGAGPRPVTVKLRTTDHGESIDPVAPPTSCVAFTRQKYVPFGRPLTLSWVAAGKSSESWFVNPARTMVPNDEDVATCHV